MNQSPPSSPVPRAQVLAERAFCAIERFMHIEAVSGVVLLAAAALALIWANSPVSGSYHALWHTPLSISFGSLSVSQSLHFWINDGLMTVFFLVVGVEIRREIHEGALSSIRLASLPLAAALGGVVVPAIIYACLNSDPLQFRGWAVPTATDIAFAVGVLALLGRAIPSNVRVLLLALAIIDDIVAVLIIAAFYGEGLNYSGLLVAGLGVLMVLGLQRIGIGNAFAYIVPGIVLWIGLLQTGAHPTLAGVVLGLMTPVLPRRCQERPIDTMTQVVGDLRKQAQQPTVESGVLKNLKLAQRELMPPVARIQGALHPWVAFGIMPLFALANAGVTLGGVDLDSNGSQSVLLGVLVALVLGKPIGVIAASALAVRLGWCRLPPNVTWPGVCVVGLLAGIGFTMSIFIANLAFHEENLLNAAKLGVLLASATAAVIGLTWGIFYTRRGRCTPNGRATEAGA
jgi:NhaA family Na+:H+ antiporter